MRMLGLVLIARRRLALLWIATVTGVVAVAACGPEARHRVLSTFFEGVPGPGQSAPPRPVVRRPRHPAPEKSQPVPAIVEVALPQPEEDLPTGPRDWQEVRRLFPKDASHDLDWVAALRAGLIAPRRTLDGAPEEREEAIRDLERTPDKEPQFSVTFSHDVHMKWLQCVNCHPDPFPERAGGAPITMEKIFQGEFCGRCHGKVAFDVSTGCLRCHRRLLVADAPKTADAHDGARGKQLYDNKCATCHGITGKGDGPKAPFLDPRPRDFTRGLFKIRSTPSGSLPTDDDLFRTITNGMPGSSMPAWDTLPEADRKALVVYIKTFADRFQKERANPSMEIPNPPEWTPRAVAEGQALYKDAGCIECHGAQGRGDGTSAPDLKDDWGARIRPADFTKPERFRGGSTARDIYRTLMNGLSGTPMPAYTDTLELEQAWQLVFYVQALGQPVEPSRIVYGDVAWERQAPSGGDQVPAAVFPHWFHRIRFACSVCHPAITQMKKGGSGITMEGLRAGKFCARCHNAKIAFFVSFETCSRCHRE